VAATAATRGLFVADDESFARVRHRDVVGGSDGRVIEDRRSETANVRTQAIECNREFRRKVY
jgi:hypothetical protein